MGRQLRSLREGEVKLLFTDGLTPASSALASIPNYGVTLLTSGADYVLAPPAQGVEKRIGVVSGTSGAYVIRGSTGTSVKFNTNGATQIAMTAGSTVDSWVHLIGINSTRWSVLNVHPLTTDAATPSVGTS